MKPPKNSVPKVSLFILTIFFLFGCTGIYTSKTSPSTGPTVDQAVKEDYMGPKARIAVTRFVDKSAKGPGSGQIGDGMTEMLANALFATNRYIVLERQSLGDALFEQDFGQSGRVRPETAARVGEIEGADILVEGAITEFDPGASGTTSNLEKNLMGKYAGTLGLSGTTKTSHVALIVKMIDARTGRRLASEEVEGKATDIGLSPSFAGSKLSGALSAYSNTSMEKAIRISIKEAVKSIVARTPANYYRFGATVQAGSPQGTSSGTPQTQSSASLPAQALVGASPSSIRITQVTKPVENLRDGPGGSIIGRATQGTSLQVLEERGKWFRVRLENGAEAWIWKASTSAVSQPSPARITQVTKPVENLRDGPGGKVIGQATQGASLQILEEKGKWFHVRLENGTEAWIWKAATSAAP